jgi:hypothetical protein
VRGFISLEFLVAARLTRVVALVFHTLRGRLGRHLKPLG